MAKTRKPRDKYSKAIRFLRKNPKEIMEAWYNPLSHRAGCLFQFATPTGDNRDGGGCLTMIRSDGYDCGYVTGRPDLKKRIASDNNIPKNPEDINSGHLKHFARWQRILDKEFGRAA